MIRRRRVRLSVMAALAVLAAGAAALILIDRPTSPPLILRTRVNLSEPGVTVPSSFLGISTDWDVNVTIGDAGTGPDPIYATLMARLAATGSGVPTLRVGGHYQDNAWWDPSKAPNPKHPELISPLTPSILQGLATNARLVHQRMIIGLNLGADDPAITKAEAQAILRYVPARDIISFDIGNEPDVYRTATAYTNVIAGHPVAHAFRPPGWSGEDYLRSFERVAGAVKSIAPALPVSGMSGYGQIVTARRFLERAHRLIAFYTEHTYPLNSCDAAGNLYRPGSPNYPTAARLLGPEGTYTTLAETQLALAAARTYRLSVHISEMNSAACGGIPGVTESMAAALWALDQFFLDASLGVHGLNMHIDGGTEAPFILLHKNGHWTGLVGPIYYAMMMFAQAVGNGGQLLVSPTTTSVVARGVNARVWAVRDPSGALRLVAINKDLKRSGRIEIAIPHSTTDGTLTRLLAPSVHSDTQVTLGGQSVPVPTSDGRLAGRRVQDTVRARHGTYSFYLPKASAALLSVPPHG